MDTFPDASATASDIGNAHAMHTLTLITLRPSPAGETLTRGLGWRGGSEWGWDGNSLRSPTDLLPAPQPRSLLTPRTMKTKTVG